MTTRLIHAAPSARIQPRPLQEPVFRCVAALVPLLATLLLVAGCATRSFHPRPDALDSFRERSQTQSEDQVTVTAAVPSPAETREYFGLDLYASGIQPVWLRVENGDADPLRFAPTGTDREYFSPLEVSYLHRGGLSSASRRALDRFLFDAALPRHIGAGETVAGFVFTHSSPGSKGFVVNLYDQGGGSYGFTFFIPVPGFLPDHAELDPDTLYAKAKRPDYDLTGFRSAVKEFPCCADGPEDPGDGRPINLVLVGSEEDVFHSLLRAGWYEVARPADGAEVQGAQHLAGRVADAMFRKRRRGKGDASELSLWLSPWSVEGRSVWWGQTSHTLRGILGFSAADPDMDDAAAYLLQDMWYSQGLRAFAWVAAWDVVSRGERRSDFTGAPFYTAGLRVVMWLSADPADMAETRRLNWDSPRIGGER